MLDDSLAVRTITETAADAAGGWSEDRYGRNFWVANDVSRRDTAGKHLQSSKNMPYYGQIIRDLKARLTVELRSALKLLRERWKLVVVVMLLCTAASGWLVWRQTPQYASRVTLFVSAWSSTDDAAAAYQGGLLSQQKVKSYTELMRSQRVLVGVVEKLHLPQSPRQLAGKITTASVRDTALLTVTVTDPSPEQAQQIANGVAEQFVKLLPSLESMPKGPQPVVRVSVVDPAELPSSPVSPQPVRTFAAAALIGLLAGLSLAVARRSLDTTIKTGDKLDELSGKPMLGTVAFDSSVGKRPLIIDAPHTPRAEAYRKIRTNLQFVDIDRSAKVIQLTSAVAGEGKSLTACNLAIALAEAQKRVLLIDADLRRPSLAEYLKLPSALGLTSVLVGRSTVLEAIQTAADGTLSVLGSGPTPPNPSELLGSQQMRRLLDELRLEFDVVLIDAPPVLPVADAAAVATACDGVLFVVRHGKTRQDQVSAAFQTLRTVEAPILGTILSLTPPVRNDSSYHYHYPVHGHVQRDRGKRGGGDSAPAELTGGPAR
jgi:capsular exopolysaccharide synthesis family protein